MAHCAACRLGAIVVPLAPVFGPEALAYRFADAGVTLAVTDAAGAAALADVHPAPAALRTARLGIQVDAFPARGFIEHVIPTANFHDTFARPRIAMDLMVSGAEIGKFHASQQAPMMASQVSYSR